MRNNAPQGLVEESLGCEQRIGVCVAAACGGEKLRAAYCQDAERFPYVLHHAAVETEGAAGTVAWASIPCSNTATHQALLGVIGTAYTPLTHTHTHTAIGLGTK